MMRSRSRLPPLLLAALLAALAVCAPAGAHGDPAGDVLRSQPRFLPDEAQGGAKAATSLTELLATAKDKGFEVRIAMIGTRVDLGAVPVLYRKPQRYADFLGQEIVFYYKGPVLVVMPNGYGIFQTGKPLKEDKATLAKIPPAGTTDGDELAASAEQAVKALAQNRGIALTEQAVKEKSSSRNRDRATIIGGVILLGAIAFGARWFLGRRRGASRAA
jgi:hypothetical protein